MNKKILVNWLIPITIYSVAFGVAIGFALNVDYTATSDPMREYSVYTKALETGEWEILLDNRLSSCITTIYLPAMVQRLLGIDPLLTYKVIHSVMVSFLPVTVYFLSKRFVKWQYALVSVGLLMAHPYSMWHPMVARMSVALIFFVLMLSVVFFDNMRAVYRIPILALCAIGIVVSHYATTYAILFIMGMSLAIILGLRIFKGIVFRHKVALTTALCFTLIASIAWLGVVVPRAQRQALGFIHNSMTTEQFEKRTEVITVVEGLPEKDANGEIKKEIAPPPKVSKPIKKEPEPIEGISSFFNVESREVTVQAAFGRTLSTASIPQKIEFVFSWFVILTLSYGVFVTIRKKLLPAEYAVMAGVSYFTILMVIALPYLSIHYSAVRVYFQALTIIGVCFVLGGVELSKMLKLKPLTIPLVVLVPYILCTSNIIHQFFGTTRWNF